MERVTIVGLGPVGISMGLALRRASPSGAEVIATSGDRRALSAASRMGAADHCQRDVASAAEGARLLILDILPDETEALFKKIAPALDVGCVVTDTGFSKVNVMEWASSLLPHGTSFVGGRPLLKDPPSRLDDANAALFEGIDYCVIPGKTAGQESLRRVVDFVEALGANPLFMGAEEHDSYQAAMAFLPRILSSAFVTATTGRGSWRDMQHMAAAEFDDMSRMTSADPRQSEAACLANRDALLHWVDLMIAELDSYRRKIANKNDDTGILDSFVEAWEARSRWESGASAEARQVSLPSAGQMMASTFLGSRLVERYRRIVGTGPKSKSGWRYQKRS